MKFSDRKKLFVDIPVQLMLVKRVLLHWLAFFFLLTLTLFALEYFLREPGTLFTECLFRVFSKHALLFVLIVCMLPVFVFDTIKMSHRFAGPISRFKRNLHALAQGEVVPEVVFRNNDYWSDLSTDFNHVARRLNQSVPTNLSVPDTKLSNHKDKES